MATKETSQIHSLLWVARRVISGDFPFSWQPPTSLKRSPGPWPAIHVLGEGTNGTGGTARLAAMSRMYSMSSYVLPITGFSRRNFKFRIPSLERITSVFPSTFKCAPRKWSSNPSLGPWNHLAQFG